MKSLRRIGKLFSMSVAGVATLFALNGDIKDKRGLENILGSRAEATTVTVEKGISNPPTTYPGINDAINATADGDTIFVKYTHQAGDETIADPYCEDIILNSTTGKRILRGETGGYLFPVLCPAPGTFNEFIMKGTNVDMDVQFFAFYGLERVNDRYIANGLLLEDSNPLVDYTANVRGNIGLGFNGSAINSKRFVSEITRNSLLSIGGTSYAVAIDNASSIQGSIINKNTFDPNRRADIDLVPLPGKIYGGIQRLPLAFDTNLSGTMVIDDTTVVVEDNVIKNTSTGGKPTQTMLPMDASPMMNINASDPMLVPRNYWYKGSVLTPSQVDTDPSVLAGPHYPVNATLAETIPDNRGLNTISNFLIDNGMAIVADTTQTTVGIPENRPNLESRIRLSNTYPNPTSSQSRANGYITNINGYVEKEGIYEVGIFRVDGTAVTDIKRIYLQKGENILGWDGKDRDGKRTSGTFFYVVKGYGEKAVGKLTLTK